MSSLLFTQKNSYIIRLKSLCIIWKVLQKENFLMRLKWIHKK